MVFGITKLAHVLINDKLLINNIAIPVTNKLKYLGNHSNSNLDFKEYVKYMIRKFNLVYLKLFCGEKDMNYGKRIIMYKGIYLSVLTYCITVFWHRTAKDKAKARQCKS